MEYDPYFVDLFDYVNQQGALSSQDSLHTVRQLIDVVQYLTEQNADHRDLEGEKSSTIQALVRLNW